MSYDSCLIRKRRRLSLKVSFRGIDGIVERVGASNALMLPVVWPSPSGDEFKRKVRRI